MQKLIQTGIINEHESRQFKHIRASPHKNNTDLDIFKIGHE